MQLDARLGAAADHRLRLARRRTRGTVAVVDTPVEGCNVQQVLTGLGIEALLRYYRQRGHNIEFSSTCVSSRSCRACCSIMFDAAVGRGTSGCWCGSLPAIRWARRSDGPGSRLRFADVEQRGPHYRFHRSHLLRCRITPADAMSTPCRAPSFLPTRSERRQDEDAQKSPG